jgi:hypothetical protein
MSRYAVLKESFGGGGGERWGVRHGWSRHYRYRGILNALKLKFTAVPTAVQVNIRTDPSFNDSN